MQGNLQTMPAHLVDGLKPLVQACYTACTKAHHLLIDVDVGSMIEASVDKAQVAFDGKASDWHELVAR